MDLLALRDQSVSRERVGVFAADQHTDLTEFCIADP